MPFENMKESASLQLVVPTNLGGQRLDLVLQQMLPDHSRSRLQGWIKEGLVLLDGKAPTAKTKVWGGENIAVTPPVNAQDSAFEPEDIPLDVVYEDDALIIINKPAGLVVHPAAGNWSGTLLNALLFHWPQLKDVPRAGIVHRLDKDTSGLLVVAKTLEAQTSLVRQLQARTVKREYRAIVWGQLWRNGKVDQPIGRHPHQRVKMAVVRQRETGGHPLRDPGTLRHKYLFALQPGNRAYPSDPCTFAAPESAHGRRPFVWHRQYYSAQNDVAGTACGDR